MRLTRELNQAELLILKEPSLKIGFFVYICIIYYSLVQTRVQELSPLKKGFFLFKMLNINFVVTLCNLLRLNM